MMNQYKLDIMRFADLLSKYTGISKSKIDKYLLNNRINNIFEHPASLDITKSQLDKIRELKELFGLYNALKEHTAQYTIKSADDAKNYFRAIFTEKNDKERMVCAFLDNKNNVIATTVLTQGTVNMSAVYPREIAKEALLYDAKSVIVSHNHPSGDVTPSNDDIVSTQRVANALYAVQVNLHDHIIVTNNDAYSFAENGLMPNPKFTLGAIFEKVKSQYIDKWPAISCISKETALAIDYLNNINGRVLSISEIKERYMAAGAALDGSSVMEASNDFSLLRSITDGLKQAQLRYAQNKSLSTPSLAIENEL